jgi:hypothetical protein
VVGGDLAGDCQAAFFGAADEQDFFTRRNLADVQRAAENIGNEQGGGQLAKKSVQAVISSRCSGPSGWSRYIFNPAERRARPASSTALPGLAPTNWA